MQSDSEKIDEVLANVETNIKNSLPQVSYMPSALIDCSELADNISQLSAELEEKNPLKEIPEVVMEDNEIKVPICGKLGKYLGLYRIITEKVPRTITKHIDFEHAMPKILSNLQSLSSSLQNTSSKVRTVLKTRISTISTMEKESGDYAALVIKLKNQYDDFAVIYGDCSKYFSQVTSDLDEMDHTHKDILPMILRRDGLERKISELQGCINLNRQELNAAENLKKRNDQFILKYMQENNMLSLYSNISDTARDYIRQQIRDGEMSFNAVYSIARLMNQFSVVSKAMFEQDTLNTDISGVLHNMFMSYAPGNKKPKKGSTT